MQKSLVSPSRCARLACVNTGNNKDLVCNFLLHGGKLFRVEQDTLLDIRRTRTNNENKSLGFPAKNLADLGSTLCHERSHCLRHGIEALHFGRSRQLAD